MLVIVSCLPMSAVPVLQLQSGATTVTVPDGDLLDSSPLPGVVTYVGAVGNFTINVTSGLTKPTQGTAILPEISLSSVDTSKQGGTLSLQFSDNNFSPAPSGPIFGSLGGTAASGGNLVFNTYVNSSNTELDTSGGAVMSQGPFTGAFSDDANTSVALTAPYSITMEAIITHPPSANGVASSFVFDLTTSGCCEEILLTCPPDIAVQCLGDVPPADFAGGTMVDPCNHPETIVTHVGDTTVGTCPTIITRTYQASNDCTNSTCTQIITVNDTIPPVITCAPNVTVQCLADVPPSSFSVSDNCDPNPAVQVTESSAGNCPTIITRTYEATDICTNQATCIQVITVHDTIPPVFTQTPPDVDLGCNPASVPVCDVAQVTATDNCGPVTITCGSADVVTDCDHTRTITYTAADLCTNLATFVQTITWKVDVTPPVLTGCSTDVSVQCLADIPAAVNVTALDDCDGPLAVNYSDTQTNPGSSCNNVITRTWTAVDECGNQAQCVQIITVNDTMPPVVTCPPDVTVQCLSDVPPADFVGGSVSDNCDPNPLVSHEGDVAVGACPTIITRTYAATDICGNQSTCTQIITVHDTIPPVFTQTPPPNVDLGCNPASVPVCDVAQVTATDNCGPVTITCASADVVTGCLHTRTITYTAADLCTNLATFVQTITWKVDVTPPVLTGCSTDVSVQCLADIPAAVNVTALDDCDGPLAVNYSDTQTNPGSSCNNVITRTWTAVDECGNQAQCVQIITVNDTMPPVVTCPPDVTVQCLSDVPPADFVGGSVSDNCDPNPLVSHEGDVAVGACPTIITRTYAATNICGNQSTCTQIITVHDTIPPVFTQTPPPNVDLGCNPASVPVCDVAQVTATDNCGPVTITCASADVVTGCLHTRTITYTAADLCTNLATFVQTITWKVDVTPPVLTGCSTDVSVQCLADVPAAVNVTALDDCDGPLAVNYNDTQSNPGSSCNNVITRTWTAVDQCGNQAQCVQIITVNDTTPPQITCPLDLTVQCLNNVPPDFAGGTVTDNCDPNPVVTHVSDQTVGTCPAVTTRTYRAVDACGNASTCVQTITAIDETPPVIVCPGDVTVECDQPTEPNVTGEATATDNCDLPIIIVYSDCLDCCPQPSCPQEKIIKRTWTATDACTNVATCVQTITVRDTTPPVLTCPPDLTVECGQSCDPSAAGQPTVMDACDPQVGTTYSDTETPGQCPQERVITRTWTATDDCGNSSICAQTITVADTTPPVVVCPPDRTVECSTVSAAPPSDLMPIPNPIYQDIDVFGDNTGDSSDGIEIAPGQTWLGRFDVTTGDSDPSVTITKTFDASQGGPVAAGTVFNDITTYIPGTSPGIVQATAYFYIRKAGPVPPGDVIGVSLNTQNLGMTTAAQARFILDGGITGVALVQLDLSGKLLYQVEVDSSSPSSIRLDYAQLQVTADTVHSVMPLLIYPPADMGTGTAIDACDPNPTVDHSDNITPGNCPGAFTIVRTWTGIDACGNVGSCVQRIDVVDTTPPVVTCPPDITVECSQPFDPGIVGQASAMDNCDPQVNVSFADTEIPGACPQERIIKRTWTAIDDCNNSGACVQTITIVDTTPPVVSCPPNATVECDAARDPATLGMANATDLCDPTPNVSYLDTFAAGPCPESGTVTRIWTATDACGNFATCQQIITVVDTTPPVLTCPANSTVECTEPTDPASIGMPGVEDNCDPQVTLTYADSVQPGACPQDKVITRTWTAIDDCQNTSTCVQRITVADTMPPVIVCPSDKTFQCDHPIIFGQATASDKCDPAPAITFADVVTPGACPEAQTITRTWTATDACGNAASCVQVVTIVDTVPPVLTCAPDKTIECDQPVVFNDPTVLDNCDPQVTVTSADSTTPGNCPQSYSVTRTWTAIDDCQNTSTCSQTITVVDSKPPVLVCPADLTIECTQPTDPPATGLATATDNCTPNPAVTFSDVQTPGVCPVAKLIRRTWSVADDCGNIATCVQIITVIDPVPPVVICPPNVTIECGQSTEPSGTGMATATDNCTLDQDISLTWGDTVTVGTCPEKLTLTRTWTARDECGNTATCVQTIEVMDTTPPVLACPSDVTVQCDAPTDPTVTGKPTATDNCDPSFEVDYADVVIAIPSCPSARLIERTWTATDDCGNSATCLQRITVQDSQPPALVCPVDVTVECDLPTDPLHTGKAVAFDNCAGQVTPASVDTIVPGNCPNSREIIRTWTAQDNCGNVATCDQHILVVDRTPPAFVNCPADQTIECLTPINFGQPVVTDNCDPNPHVTSVDVETPGQCPQSKMVSRTWTATDACGNAATCRQVITVVDQTPPVVVCPPNVTVQCDQLNDPSATGSAGGIDHCDPNPSVTYSDTVTDRDCPEQRTITRTWTVRDACGNAATCAQIITVVDMTPPVVVCPADVTIECDAASDPSATGMATATDECDPVFSMTYSDSVGPGGCAQARIITRTWTATDDCQNISTCVQRITLLDRTPPQVFCPPNLTLECQTPTTPDSTGSASAIDNCDPSPTVSHSETITAGPCPEAFTLNRTWTAIDACGNAAACVQTITVMDTTPPAFVSCPADVTLQCGQPTDPGSTGQPIAQDNCDPVINITPADIVSPGRCAQEKVITRTWTARDDCQNTATCVQRITVVDNIPPTLTGCPADVTAQCDAVPAPATPGANDNCDLAPVVTLVETTQPGSCPEAKTLIRTWTATDACGNASSCSQRVTVVDTTPPVIACPPNATVQCDQLSDPAATGMATATDNCDPVFEITYSDSVAPGSCPQAKVVTRTWTAKDDCQNTSTCVQIITVVDTTPPVVMCPPDRAVECDQPTTPDNLGSATATDNCDDNPALTFTDSTAPGPCPQSHIITRTWKATDACGNSATCIQIITQVDTTAPVIACPANQTVECDQPVNFGQPTITDNCDPNPVVVFTDNTTPGPCPQAKTLTRTWTATDACGNTASCQQIISVVDTTPPVIACPANLTVQCDQPINFGQPTVHDNCDPNPAVTFTDATTPGPCPQAKTVTRTWTARDACGNAASCQQVVTVVDTVPPVITCPPNVTVLVNSPTDPANTCTPTATDNCDPNPTFQHSDTSMPGTCPGESIIKRTWTATDACGNSASCDQQISVIELTPCLTITKTPSADQVLPFTPVTYTYWVSNCSCVTATDVVVADDNGTPDFAGDDVVVGTIAVLGAGESVQLERTLILPVDVCCPTDGVTGQLLTEILPNGNIKVSFVQAFDVNDNTYGANTIGWGGPGKHSFNNLVGSDHAEFAFSNGAGQTVLQFQEDYISAASTSLYPSGYGTLGVTGGEGKMITGSAASVLATSTSLSDNLNQPPFLNNVAQYTKDSPALSDPNSAQWEYYMVYTVVVDKNAFGPSGFSSVAIVDQHNSPSKRKVCSAPDVCSPQCVTNTVVVSGQAMVMVTTNCTQQVPVTRATLATDTAVVCIATPPPPCGPCQGKVSELTLQYLGATPNAQIKVTQKNGATVFQGTVQPGGQFTFHGTDNGTFGTEITIMINGVTQTSIHTSCSQPIGPGLVRGDFRVIGGSSMQGGPLCPLNLPCIEVIKEIACLLPNDACGAFGKIASGVAGSQDPGFCYRITVTNCGPVGLDNLHVQDNQMGDLTSLFFANASTVLPVNGTVTRIVKMSWGQDTTNVVVATGQSVVNGDQVSDTDQAVALVTPARLTCMVTVTSPCDTDGNPSDNHVSLPNDSTPCAVTFTVQICNEGMMDLTQVTLSAPELVNLGCALPAPFNLASGECQTFTCTETLNCEALGGQSVVAHVTATANVVSIGTQCNYDFNGLPVQAGTACEGVISCGAEPKFLLFKNADKTIVEPGGVVTYTYTVTNNGTVTINDLVVSDDNGTPSVLNDDVVVGTLDTLAPGASHDFVRSLIMPVRLCSDQTGKETGTIITQVLPNGNIQATFIQSFAVNDNTYGVNSIGWGSKVHKFSNLTGSDKAEFQFKNGAGQVVLDFQLDYISSAPTSLYPSGYGTLGVTGGDGKMQTGDVADVVFTTTSLTENLNKPPFLNNLAQYTVNSPALNDPNSGQWEYRMIYTAVVSQAAFGASGFGGVMIVDQHNSPAKIDKFTPEACSGCVTNIATAIATAGGITLPSQFAQEVVCSGTPVPTPGGECPQKADYWKKNTGVWPAAYSPNQSVGSVFVAASLYHDAEGKSLLQAVDGKAGSKEVKDMLKEAVAALLNAATDSIQYPFTPDEVITAVNMALTNGGKDSLKSLKELLKDANDNKDCNKPSKGGNCDTNGKPNMLTLSYTGQSCAQASNAQMAYNGKTSCSETAGGPQGAASVRVIASSSSTPPTGSSGAFFDGTVNSNQTFDVHGKFGSNTYFHVYVGNTLVQTIQMHTSCSAPLVRGDTFGSLMLVDYGIVP